MLALCFGLVILNLLDIVFTLLSVYSDVAYEANPLMAWLVVNSPVAFAIVKSAFIFAGTLCMWHYGCHRFAIVGVAIPFVLYSWVVFFVHLPMLGLVLARLSLLP